MEKIKPLLKVRKLHNSSQSGMILTSPLESTLELDCSERYCVGCCWLRESFGGWFDFRNV